MGPLAITDTNPLEPGFGQENHKRSGTDVAEAECCIGSLGISRESRTKVYLHPLPPLDIGTVQVCRFVAGRAWVPFVCHALWLHLPSLSSCSAQRPHFIGFQVFLPHQPQPSTSALYQSSIRPILFFFIPCEPTDVVLDTSCRAKKDQTGVWQADPNASHKSPQSMYLEPHRMPQPASQPFAK